MTPDSAVDVIDFDRFRLLVQQWLDETGESQKVLAKRAGISQAYISRLIRSKRGPHAALPHAFALAAAIDVDLRDILLPKTGKPGDPPELLLLISRLRRLYQRIGPRVLDLVSVVLRGMSAERGPLRLARNRDPVER